MWLAVFDRDPACFRYTEPLLYLQGVSGGADLSHGQPVVAHGAEGFRVLPAKPDITRYSQSTFTRPPALAAAS